MWCVSPSRPRRGGWSEHGTELRRPGASHPSTSDGGAPPPSLPPLAGFQHPREVLFGRRLGTNFEQTRSNTMECTFDQLGEGVPRGGIWTLQPMRTDTQAPARTPTGGGGVEGCVDKRLGADPHLANRPGGGAAFALKSRNESGPPPPPLALLPRLPRGNLSSPITSP